MTHRLALLSLLLFAGCSIAPRAPEQAPGGFPPPPPGARFEAEPGRDATTIAAMRAAPAPTQPPLEPGRNRAGDRNRLAAQGYVPIGTGWFPGSEAQAREDALRQGRNVGADRILLYPPAGDATTGAEWIAAYYVRFQLPFGATFRDLHAAERDSLGGVGGVQIGSVIGGTPASRANLRPGDFVLKFDGKPVADRAAFQALLKQHAGRSVTLTIVRNGETLQRAVRLGAMTAAER